MDLTDIYTIKSILRENRIRPNKQFGQNFLVDRETLIKLINSAQIKTDDIIVEIGPGLGTITQELAKRAKLVLAIEKDYNLVTWLRRYFKGHKNVKIIHNDILRFAISDLRSAKYKVVSALPYNITSPVIRKFLTGENKPKEMILIIQKEVAQRICAKPGNSERGFLTVLVEFFSDAEIIDFVDRSSFWPSPKVDSAILRIRIKNRELRIKNVDLESFFRLVKAGFSQKRRQIHNPLKANLHIAKDQIFAILKKAGIEMTKRAEELTMEEWMQLYKILNSKL